MNPPLRATPRSLLRFNGRELFLLCLGVLALGPARGAASRSPSALPTRLECVSIDSALLGRSVPTCVALPAGYDSSTGTRYPTLYFLHGLYENERSWSERGGKRILEELLDQGRVGEFVVVVPNGGMTFYVNSVEGREPYEDFFIQELVPAIDRKYRTIPRPAGRGISGTSMGGYGALHLAMRHPDAFGSASAHSAALLRGLPETPVADARWARYASVLEGAFGSPLDESYWEANSPLALAENPQRFSQLKLYFDCGDRDRYGFDQGALLLDRILSEKGFAHEFALRPGDHGWSYLAENLKFSLLFHWRCFEEGERSVAATRGKDGSP